MPEKILIELDIPSKIEPEAAKWVGSMALKGINEKIGHLGILARIVEGEEDGSDS